MQFAVLQVNKPYLPLASGEYSIGTGVTIVTSFLFTVSGSILCLEQYFCKITLFCEELFISEQIMILFLLLQSFWLGWVVGSWPLFWALFISFILGTAYSVDVSSTFPLEFLFYH